MMFLIIFRLFKPRLKILVVLIKNFKGVKNLTQRARRNRERGGKNFPVILFMA